MSSPASGQTARITSHLLADDADLRDVVVEFVTGLPGRVSEIRQAHAAHDLERLRVLAHRLKGAGGSYGYPDVSLRCADLEQRCRADALGDFERWLAEFERLVNAMSAGLKSDRPA